MLRRIYRLQPVTREALAAEAGLSANRISTLVTHLLAEGLVCEQPRKSAGRGRPPAPLAVSPGVAQVVGLDIGGLQSRAVLYGADGRVQAWEVWPTEAVPLREVILDNIVRLIEAVCSKGQTGPDRLAALGVGVRAIVDTQHGVVLTWPNTPAWAAGWAGLDVPAALRGRLHVDRVFVDDSVRTMARAAHRAGPARGVSEFIYVFLGTGIGSAVFTDGRPYAGRSGMAGELGHVAIDERGPRCTCGNRGCLEMLASTPAVLRRARERLAESPHPSMLSEAHALNRITLQVLHEAAQAGDKLAIQVLTETGTDVGRVLAIALNLLDPEMVVLGGPLVHEGGVLVDAVRREARLRALPHISRALRIACDDQGAMAGARGAAFLALDAIFAPDGMAFQ